MRVTSNTIPMHRCTIPHGPMGSRTETTEVRWCPTPQGTMVNDTEPVIPTRRDRPSRSVAIKLYQLHGVFHTHTDHSATRSRRRRQDPQRKRLLGVDVPGTADAEQDPSAGVAGCSWESHFHNSQSTTSIVARWCESEAGDGVAVGRVFPLYYVTSKGLLGRSGTRDIVGGEFVQ